MRLLDTLTGQFIEHHPKYLRARYAILSHTWDPKGEQSYQELKEIQRRYVPDNERPQLQLEDTLRSKHEPYVAADFGWEMSPAAPMSTLSESSPPPIHAQDVISEDQSSPSENLSLPSNEALPRAPTLSWRRFLLGSHILRFTERLRKNYRRTPATSSPSSTGSPSVTGQPSAQLNTPPPPAPQVEVDPPPTYTPVPSSGNPSGPTGPSRSIWDDPALSPKIRDACAVARADGYRYLWIDSCCIDKTSSAELSEAINSMYRWYAHAALCYAFLADVPFKADHARAGSRFRRSRWFTRGWTLQELVAPLRVVFLARDWRAIGSKHALAALVADVTGIAYNALLHVEPLESVSVAQRLSWACERQTTRVEDRAYALLGIFDICMPTLYGEGERAFRRLQEEIMRRIPDQSLFAWKETYLPPVPLPVTLPGCEGVAQPGEPTLFQCLPGSRLEGTSLLATSLSNFRQGRHIETVPHDEVFRRLQLPALPASDYDFTPHGIRTRVPVIPLSAYLPPGAAAECPDDNVNVSLAQCYLVILGCEHQTAPGHLLGRVCYIPPSQSGIERLYAGRMSVSPSPRGSGSPSNNNVFSLFPLSPETLARCRPSLEIRTVYISHPGRADGALEVARWQNHTEINLVLLRATLDALRARGYTASLRGPDPVSHPTTHWLTLAHSTHIIAVEFEHRLTYDGRDLDVSASLKLSGPFLEGDTTPEQVHEELRGAACWFFSRPWDSNDSSSTKRVELGAAGGTRLAVYLKLYFATQNHYVVEASVEALEDPSTAVPRLSPACKRRP